mmetsp:Transcript_31833/g.105519  ORF Transcript_31833/g.105519 Transcript_31833/m.105519 type:complete len:210 (+) Transcript_31833:1433-2062(+)
MCDATEQDEDVKNRGAEAEAGILFGRYVYHLLNPVAPHQPQQAADLGDAGHADEQQTLQALVLAVASDQIPRETREHVEKKPAPHVFPCNQTRLHDQCPLDAFVKVPRHEVDQNIENEVNVHGIRQDIECSTRCSAEGQLDWHAKEEIGDGEDATRVPRQQPRRVWLKNREATPSSTHVGENQGCCNVALTIEAPVQGRGPLLPQRGAR